MVNIVWMILLLGGFITAVFNGRIEAVTQAAFDRQDRTDPEAFVPGDSGKKSRDGRHDDEHYRQYAGSGERGNSFGNQRHEGAAAPESG